MAPNFQPSNTRKAFDFLTGDGIVERSGGSLHSMTPEAASGLIGNWIVETGSPDLTNLDVVERGNNQAGRGLSQWSHSRRAPYDAARDAAINAGIDPNSMDFQLGYFVDEYTGKHDGANGSLIGWTNSIQNHGQSDNLSTATTGFQNDYFRPTKPHQDRRLEAAQRVYSRMAAPQPVQNMSPNPYNRTDMSPNPYR